MSSLFFEKPSKSKPKGRWILQYQIYIDGSRRSPPGTIKRAKKSDIPNKVRLAAEALEKATMTGTATNAEIDQWVKGFPESRIRPLISTEEACQVFPGYGDTLRRTGTWAAIDFDGVREAYSDERLANQTRGVDTDNRSHRESMNEYDRVVDWVKEAHPTLTTLTPDAYFQWWLGLRGRFASSTVNKRNYALRAFLRICVTHGMIAESPYDKDRCPTLKQITDTKRRILDFDEVEATIERIRDEEDFYLDHLVGSSRVHPMHGCLPIAQMIALNTGIRTKEARWLEWDVCHLHDRKPSTMVIQRVKSKKTGYIGNVKTGEWREIGINSLLKEWLRKEKARQKKLGILGQFVIPSGRFDQPSRRGNPISDNQIGDSMLEFNKREYDIYKRPEWPTYYSYRHTFATNLLRSGKDLESVRERMGHTSIATTQKYLRYLDAAETTIEDDLPWVSAREAAS